MTQKVRVLLQLTLDADVLLSKTSIETLLLNVINTQEWKDEISYPSMDVISTEIVQIEEESEIYGTEEGRM